MLKHFNGSLINLPPVVSHISSVVNSGFSCEFIERFLGPKVVDETRTNASQNGNHYRIQFDNDNIAVVGDAVTFASTPGFVVGVGDVLVQGKVFAMITDIVSEDQFIVSNENLVSGPATLSQALWSEDILNYGDESKNNRISDILPGPISSVMVHYEDSSLKGINDQADISFAVSVDDRASFSSVMTKSNSIEDPVKSIKMESPGINGHIVLFSNKAMGSGHVRLFSYNFIC